MPKLDLNEGANVKLKLSDLDHGRSASARCSIKAIIIRAVMAAKNPHALPLRVTWGVNRELFREGLCIESPR
jgi:hypothetical protein